MSRASRAHAASGRPLLRRPDPAHRHRRLGVLPAADGVATSSPRREEREALATNITIALAGDPDAGRRGAPADRAPDLPGGRVGDWRWTRTSDGGPGLARLPGGDVPARLGEGLLDQGGLPRRTARASAACARSCPAGCSRQLFGFYQRSEKALGLDDDAVAGRRRSRAGPSRPSGSAGRWRPAPCTPGTPLGRGRLAVPARGERARWRTRRRRRRPRGAGARARSSRWWRAQIHNGRSHPAHGAAGR